MNFEAALGALETAGVKFVIVGAYAAVVQGAGLATQDLDLCYERSPENLKRLVSVLRDIHARLRGAPEGLPFLLDERTLAQGMNFTFETDYGDLDLLGELSGVGQYSDLARDAVTLEIFGRSYQAASLEAIIRSKKAAGRPKDLNALPELEAIRDMTKKLKTPGPPEAAEVAEVAMKQRIQRLDLGTPFDQYASPKPTITQPPGQREARKQWGALNTAQKTVVEHVLRNGRVPLAELLRWMNHEGIEGGIDTVRSITRTTNFLQGGMDDEGYWTNPDFKTQLEELIGS